MMNRFMRRTLKVNNDDDEILTDQYVLVEAAAADEENDDDDMVVINANDAVSNEQHPPLLSIPFVSDSCSKPNDNDTVVVSRADVVVAVVVSDTTEKKGEEEEDVCGHEKADVENAFDTTRTNMKAGTILLMLISLLLFDAGDFYGWYGRNNRSKPCHTPIDEYDGPAEEESVPAPAPTEGIANYFKDYESILDMDHQSIVEIALSSRSSSDFFDFVERPIHRSDGSAVTIWETKYHTVIEQQTDDSTTVSMTSSSFMIPTVRRISSMILTTHPHIASETPHPLLLPEIARSLSSDGEDHHRTTNKPVSSPPSIPMRSLIPYTTPRRIEMKAMHIPSVRAFEDWIPTNNWTSSVSDTNITTSTVAIDCSIDPERKVTTNRSDQRPWNDEQQHGSIDLTEYTFRDFIQQYDNVLVTFYLPCQDFTTTFVPMWNNLSMAIQREQLPVVTATVDCDSHPSICREQGCHRFPTIRWFHKGIVLLEDYGRVRTVHKLLRFVRTALDQISETTVPQQQQSNRLKHPEQMTNVVAPPVQQHDVPNNLVDLLLGDLQHLSTSKIAQQRLKSVKAFVKKQRTIRQEKNHESV